MGMFQSQNYGADFVNSMAATSGMLNDRRKLDMAEKESAQQQQRYAAEAETRGIQNEGLRLDNQKKTADAKLTKDLQDFTLHAGRLESGQLTPEDYSRLGGVTMDLLKNAPYLPSDPAQAPEYKQRIGTLIKGVEALRTLPASNYKYTREDNVPEVNATLDAYQGLLSSERLGKTFTDADGSVTGKAGTTYKTSGVGGFVMQSGEGNKAAFVPMFSVTDEQGKPLIGADGKAVLVPATEDGSNGPNAKLRMVTPEEMLTKAGFAYKVLDVADKMGLADPEKRKAYVNSTIPAYMGEKGAEQLLKNSAPEKKEVKEVDTSKALVDAKTGKVIREAVPKEKEDKAPTSRTVKRNGYEITEEYEGKGKWKEVAKNKIKEPAVAGDKTAKGVASGQQRDVKEIVDEYQAIKTKRGDQYAKDTEELRKVNAERAKPDGMGDVKPPLTFQQHFGADESPAHAALTRNMYQLRDVARDSLKYDLINMKPYDAKPAAKGMAAPAKKAATQTAAAPAPKAKPITATNKATGQRIVSNDGGKSWQPI